MAALEIKFKDLGVRVDKLIAVPTHPKVVWDDFTYPRVACFGGIALDVLRYRNRLDRFTAEIKIRLGARFAVVYRANSLDCLPRRACRAGPDLDQKSRLPSNRKRVPR